jgi:hypothetical protein
MPCPKASHQLAVFRRRRFDGALYSIRLAALRERGPFTRLTGMR